MHNLCRADDKEMVLRYFELHLLDVVGYRPQLNQCVSCHSTLPPVINSFSSSAGGVLCLSCRQSQPSTYPLSVGVLKILRFLQSNDYNTASRLKITPELSRRLEEVTRGYFKYLLEREIKSADWLDTLREQMKAVTSGIV